MILKNPDRSGKSGAARVQISTLIGSVPGWSGFVRRMDRFLAAFEVIPEAEQRTHFGSFLYENHSDRCRQNDHNSSEV